MNDKYNILKRKLELIINKDDKSKENKEFADLLRELEGLKNDSIGLANSSFFSKLFASIRAKFVKPVEKEFDAKRYEEIKRKAIQLYEQEILYKEKPIEILEPDDYGEDAYFIKNNSMKEYAALLSELEKFEAYKTRLREKEDGDIEIYPWKVYSENLKSTVDKEYKKIAERVLTSDCDVDKAFEERAEEYSSKNKAIKNRFLKAQITPYQGSPEYITKRSEFILECIEKIISAKEVKEEHKEKSKELIGEARFVLNKIENCRERINIRSDDRTYDEMKRHFEKLLALEDIISEDVAKIWDDFLTKPEEYKEGERYAFLVHTFTKGVVNPDQINHCCCTLVTNECSPVVYGNIGIICGYNKENVRTMCTIDAGSWIHSKEDTIDNRVPIGWNFADYAGDENHRYNYDEYRISKLILPTTMEKEMKDNNLNIKEQYEEDKAVRGYTEVFMAKGKNGEEIPIQGVFYTNEKGREMANSIKGNFNPILIDPSKGTIPFEAIEDETKSEEKIREEDK